MFDSWGLEELNQNCDERKLLPLSLNELSPGKVLSGKVQTDVPQGKPLCVPLLSKTAALFMAALRLAIFTGKVSKTQFNNCMIL